MRPSEFWRNQDGNITGPSEFWKNQDGNNTVAPSSTSNAGKGRVLGATITLLVHPWDKTYVLSMEKVATLEGLLSTVSNLPSVKRQLNKYSGSRSSYLSTLKSLLDDGIWEIQNENKDIFLVDDWPSLVATFNHFILNTNEETPPARESSRPFNSAPSSDYQMGEMGPGESYFHSDPLAPPWGRTSSASDESVRKFRTHSSPYGNHGDDNSSSNPSVYSDDFPPSDNSGGVALRDRQHRYPPSYSTNSSHSIERSRSVLGSSQYPPSGFVPRQQDYGYIPSTNIPYHISNTRSENSYSPQPIPSSSRTPSTPRTEQSNVSESANAVVIITAYIRLKVPCVYPPPPNTKKQKCSFSPTTSYWKALKSLSQGGNGIYKLDVCTIDEELGGEKILRKDYAVVGARDKSLAELGFLVSSGQGKGEYIAVLK